MRYLRYLLLAVLAIGLMTVSLANVDPVTLRLVPPDLAALIGFDFAIQLPLFAVVLGGIVAGVLIGFVWEWVREHKHRALAADRAREVARLEQQVARTAPPAPRDEVLALLEAPRKAG